MDKFRTASDPNADPIELIRLASDEEWEVRSHVARNPSAPREALIKLAFDKDWVIRTYVASNPSAPREALEMLLLDLKIHDKVISALLERNKKSGQI